MKDFCQANLNFLIQVVLKLSLFHTTMLFLLKEMKIFEKNVEEAKNSKLFYLSDN